MSKKIFSGVQPTGNLHLGNYLGAIKNFVDLQKDKDNSCIYCVVDLHAITVKQDPKVLKKNIRETTASFLASGLNSNKSIIFNQSMVPSHAEGSWLLSCDLDRSLQGFRLQRHACLKRPSVSGGFWQLDSV